MTKFEEVLNKVIFNGVTPITNEKFYLKSILLGVFSNWHSDEELKIEENEVNRLFTENKELKGRAEFSEKKACEFSDNLDCASERIVLLEGMVDDLKSQLQQQALPVVPDFMAVFINNFGKLEDGKYINYSANYLENKKELEWIDKHQKTWVSALANGFTVEKTKRFYLKNKVTKKYLFMKAFGGYDEEDCNLDIRLTEDFQFTQEEIDNMETGSYDILPLEEEE